MADRNERCTDLMLDEVRGDGLFHKEIPWYTTKSNWFSSAADENGGCTVLHQYVDSFFFY